MTSSVIPVITADHMQLASLSANEPFLPDEIILEIFSHLNLQELATCCSTAKRFSRIDELVLKKIKQCMTTFAKEEWETYFGEVGEAPPLPPLKVLNEIYKTYMLVLLPESVDGNPLTLNLFTTHAKNPKVGHETIINFKNLVIAKFGSVANFSSRWVLFPKVLLENTSNKIYAQQIEVVTAKGEEFEVPLILDAVVSIASRHVQSGERLFNDCYTRCQETINYGWGDTQLIVGAFSSNLRVLVDAYDYDVYVGVAAVRK